MAAECCWHWVSNMWRVSVMNPAVLKDVAKCSGLFWNRRWKELCERGVKKLFKPIKMTPWIHPEWPVQIIKASPSESADRGVCGPSWTLEWQQATCCLYLWTCGLEFMKWCRDPSADYKFQVAASCKLSEKTVIRSESPWTWFSAGRLLFPGAAVS